MKSLKIINLITIGLIVVLAISLLGLSLYKKKLLDSTSNLNETTSVGIKNDSEEDSVFESYNNQPQGEIRPGGNRGTVSSVDPTTLEIQAADGGTYTFDLTLKDFFYFCSKDDPIMHEEVRGNDGMVVNTMYMVEDIDDFTNQVDLGDEVEVFYVEFKDTVYFNGLVLLNCE